jgi:hypothetical protein
MGKLIAIGLTVLGLGLFPQAHSVFAKTWSLENTPQIYRPKLCADLRAQLLYDLGTQSYRYAIKRQAEGRVWRIHQARLDQVARNRDSMRRLRCPGIP